MNLLLQQSVGGPGSGSGSGYNSAGGGGGGGSYRSNNTTPLPPSSSSVPPPLPPSRDGNSRTIVSSHLNFLESPKNIIRLKVPISMESFQ